MTTIVHKEKYMKCTASYQPAHLVIKMMVYALLVYTVALHAAFMDL